jgi:F-type H+-transporting ATPase subunit b
MNMLGLLTLVQEAEAHGGPASPFEVNFGLFFWTWVVFLALLYVLKKFAWPPLVKATEEREKRLQALLDEAERARAEAEATLAEHRKLLAEGKSTAHALLTEARATAEKERAVALEKTRAEQEELLARARRDIIGERERAIAELRREAVDLSLAAASKLIGERLTSETDRTLVEKYLASLEAQR